MPKRNPTPQDVARFANHVVEHLQTEMLPIAWLAKRLGMADSTLRWQLENSSHLKLKTCLAILGIFGWTLEDLDRIIRVDAEPAEAVAS